MTGWRVFAANGLKDLAEPELRAALACARIDRAARLIASERIEA